MQQMSVLRNPIPISKETIHLCLNIYLQKHNACCSGGYSHKIPGQVVPRPMGIVLKAKEKKKKKQSSVLSRGSVLKGFCHSDGLYTFAGLPESMQYGLTPLGVASLESF